MRQHILAITVLTLSLSVTLVAQTREHEQTLESLRDIDLVVRYGHVDGQEESWQSDLLQRLEDRARQRLWEAEIPLSQSKDDVGKPAVRAWYSPLTCIGARGAPSCSSYQSGISKSAALA